MYFHIILLTLIVLFANNEFKKEYYKIWLLPIIIIFQNNYCDYFIYSTFVSFCSIFFWIIFHLIFICIEIIKILSCNEYYIIKSFTVFIIITNAIIIIYKISILFNGIKNKQFKFSNCLFLKYRPNEERINQ